MPLCALYLPPYPQTCGSQFYGNRLYFTEIDIFNETVQQNKFPLRPEAWRAEASADPQMPPFGFHPSCPVLPSAFCSEKKNL